VNPPPPPTPTGEQPNDEPSPDQPQQQQRGGIRSKSGGSGGRSQQERRRKSNVGMTVECGVCSELVQPVKFLPCSHAIVCADCGARMKKCFQCKAVIEAKVEQSGGPNVTADDVTTDDVINMSRNERELVERLHDLEEQYKCTICMESKITVVFNCGHVSCSKCVETLKLCHMCRKPIQTKTNIYC